MFDNLTPEENDALRASMMRAVVKASKLAMFAARDAQLWASAHSVMTDCSYVLLDLVAAI